MMNDKQDNKNVPTVGVGHLIILLDLPLVYQDLINYSIIVVSSLKAPIFACAPKESLRWLLVSPTAIPHLILKFFLTEIQQLSKIYSPQSGHQHHFYFLASFGFIRLFYFLALF